jgi:S-adenosylmethionine/arginine decarboxylase-like enzyme
MVAYGPPMLKHFGKDNKKGYTLVQLIETSNVVCHFVEETDDAYIDVFSCKPFSAKDAEDVVKKYFRPSQLHSQMLERSAPAALLLE